MKIVLGVTGGIAAYKSCELIRLLRKDGVDVQVVMTEAATQFVTPVTMQALSGQPVFTDQWDRRMPNNMAHIELSRGADALLIAPASADAIAKIAHGLADDLLTTMVLARNCPLLVAPAMNVEMWRNAATQRNLQTLIGDGVHVLGPGSGEQACGEVGDGRMLEAAQLRLALWALVRSTPKLLAGKRVLITAGPTVEPIDPVRVMTNRSSGKMGYSIAQACVEAGADVTLISGPVALATPAGVRRVDVQTALQMHAAVMGQVNGNDAAPDLFIAVAAVADWRVAEPQREKIKKTGNGAAPPLNFIENPDILADVAALDNGPWCVGFAAETQDLLRNGQDKRKRKGIDLLVGNIGPQTFGKDDNELLLIDAHGSKTLPRADKLSLARQLVTEIAQRMPVRAS